MNLEIREQAREMEKKDFGMVPDADDVCLVQEDLNPLPRSVRRRTLRLTVTPSGGNNIINENNGGGEDEPLAVAELILPLEAGEQPQRVPMQLPYAKLWSPAEPNLYHLRANRHLITFRRADVGFNYP
jgi:hypothetical protein